MHGAHIRRAFPPHVLAMVLLAGLVVAGVAVAAESLDRPFGFFSREPSEVLGAPFYTGFLFHVGLLVWFASAVACLFGGCLVAALRGRRAAAPLLAAGLLSTVLALDDALRIHEDLLPGKLGLPKIGTYALYAVAFGAWLWFFRDFVRRTPWPLLGFAGLMLGTSVGLDRVFESHQRHLFEDGAKFVGIVAWTAYFVRTSFASALEAVAARPVSDESKAALAEPAAAPARGERRFERRRDRQPLPR